MGLVIAGMHRSGTSAVARLVEALDVSPGDADMGPAPDNPLGFFERRDVVVLSDRWLAELGGSWWAPPLTTAATWSELDAEQLRADRTSLDLFDPRKDRWFVKDPRLSLLLPLWDRLALRTLPAVLALRDPRECVMSLYLRDGIAPRRALALWFEYLRQAILYSADRSLLLLDYNQLVEYPTPAVAALAEFVAGACGQSERLQSPQALVELVEPALRRNRHSRVHGVSAAEMDDALDLYRLLAKHHAEHGTESVDPVDAPPWVDELLEDLREAHRRKRQAEEATSTAHSLEIQLQERTADLDLLRLDLDQQRSAQALVTSELTRAQSLLREAEFARESAVIELEEVRASATVAQEASQQALAGLVAERNSLATTLQTVRRREEVLSGTVRDLTGSFEQVRGESARLKQEVDHTAEMLRERVSALETDLVHREAESRRLRAQLVHAEAMVEELTELWLELTREIGEVSAVAARRQEALASLTGALERMRAQALVAGEVARRTPALEAALAVEQARRDRLEQALAQALGEGQRVAAELEAIRASRSYRYGRRLCAPARSLRAAPTLPSDGESVHHEIVTSVPAADLVVMIDAGVFDAAWYADLYPDVVVAGVDPWGHFVTQGWREGRSPGPAFDLAWYRKRYGDEIPSDTNPLVFYLREGWKRGHWPAAGFDPDHDDRAHPQADPPDVAPILHALAVDVLPNSEHEGRRAH